MNTKNSHNIVVKQCANGVDYEMHYTLATLKLRTCLCCSHFTEATETCNAFAGPPQRPPARIIVSGCGSYDEEIPF